MFNQNTGSDSSQKFIPHITILLGIACVGLFVGINLEPQHESWTVLRKWGSPSADQIFDGDYWGLITSNFLHVEIWHIAFNLYWLWILGRSIEYYEHRANYLLLIFTAALVSSLAQLGFSESTGIGLSGIGYALFGFVVVKSIHSEDYKRILDKRTMNLFFIWLIACIILTEMEVLNVGNAAHIGGLIWGLSYAYFSKFNIVLSSLFRLIVLAVIGTSMFWNPFSTTLLAYEAGKLHNSQKLEEAMEVYREILDRDSDNNFATVNLNNLEVVKLSREAFELHSQDKTEEAAALYKEILDRKPDDKFAKTNLLNIEVNKLSKQALRLHEEKNYEEARKVYNNILKLDPKNDWAKGNMELLP